VRQRRPAAAHPRPRAAPPRPARAPPQEAALADLEAELTGLRDGLAAAEAEAGKLPALEASLGTSKDQYLRLQADFENFRRRTVREVRAGGPGQGLFRFERGSRWRVRRRGWLAAAARAPWCPVPR
jgi:hypothetical protein